VSRRAASISVAMSASIHWIAWNRRSPSELLPVLRIGESVLERGAAIPIAWEAMPIRPRRGAHRDLNPSPSFPSRSSQDADVLEDDRRVADALIPISSRASRARPPSISCRRQGGDPLCDFALSVIVKRRSVRLRGVRDEVLRAVDDVEIAVTNRGRLLEPASEPAPAP